MRSSDFIWQSHAVATEPRLPMASSGASLTELKAWLRRYASRDLDVYDLSNGRRFPARLIAELGRRGVLGAHLPAAYGGLGLSWEDIASLIEQVAAIDVELASFCVLHYTATLPLLWHASTELKEELLPQAARGELIASLALTEPGAGANPRGMESTLTEADGGYTLTGSKDYIGNAQCADIMVCFARLPAHGITAFVVRARDSGVSVEPELDTVGVRAMHQNRVNFTNVTVPASAVLGALGAGMEVAERTLSIGRLLIGAMGAGCVARASDFMYRYASRRHIATGLLIDNEITRGKLHGAYCAAHALVATVQSIAQGVDQAADSPLETYIACKVAGSELAFEFADAYDLQANLGIDRETPV